MSAIVPVAEGRYDNVAKVFEEYRDALAATGSSFESFEMIYVLDGELPMVREALRGLKDAGAPLTIVQMAKPYGEALAIMVGFEHASGEVILTLPAVVLDGDTSDRADHPVGDDGWDLTGHELVLALVAPADHDIEALPDLFQEHGDVARVVLEIAVHG
ncbi:MAG: hypothetical protein M3461_05310 [Pseudomonadota bacterium]|nr:hypothetical protein [Pseudomonadota bacterium]